MSGFALTIDLFVVVGNTSTASGPCAHKVVCMISLCFAVSSSWLMHLNGVVDKLDVQHEQSQIKAECQQRTVAWCATFGP